MSEAQTDLKNVDVNVSTELKNIIEALIFASDEPMTVRFIRSIVDDVNKDLPPEQQLVLNAEIIRKAVGDLNRGYGRLGSGFRIIEVAGGFVYATLEQFASWVGKLAKERARRRLSPTAVETLAIIAYKQPITKSEVEFIRGVNVDYIINALLEKDLIQITGRQNSPGRPLLYGTTQKFLEHFGLNELTDLPKPREIAELISETEIEVDRRLLAEQQELEFQEGLDKKLEGHEGATKKEKTPRQPRSGARRTRDETTGTAMEQSVRKNEEAEPSENIPADSAADSVVAEHELPADRIAAPTHANDEEGVHLSTDQIEIQRPEHPEQTDDAAVPGPTAENVADSDKAEHEAHPEKGWSKWKTKVKTFFKKLFG
jgi:segregation and condensation protein B